MHTTQTEFVDYRTKECAVEDCHKEAGNHMYYDTTLCEDHALDDEVHRSVTEQAYEILGNEIKNGD